MRQAAPPQPSEIAGFAEALLDWYGRGHRNLPWRQTRDPYCIWVAEVMLQQTRVQAVQPYYERFIGRFPTVRALARAPLDDVLASWSGLGYYSRARNLHRAAGEVIARYRGDLPRTARDLIRLPGIGRYTAGAIASIAFGEPAPIVDGNVERVLARAFLIDDRAKAWRLATELVQHARARSSALNQSLMELGAVVCTPRRPACLVCPVASMCAARARGIQDVVPRRRQRRAIPTIEAAVVVVLRGRRVLLAQRPPSGLWGGLWEFPTAELDRAEAPESAAQRAVRGAIMHELCIGTVEHTLTHRRMRFRVFTARASRARVITVGYEAHRFTETKEVETAPISNATRRIWRLSRLHSC